MYLQTVFIFSVQFVGTCSVEGPYIIYNNDGSREEAIFKNGKIEGPYTHYFKNGDRQEGTYKNGEKGPYKYYFNDGSIEEGIYKNGQRIKLR